MQGFLRTALVVGSYHVLPSPDDPGAFTLRVYWGEGDRYGCWADFDRASIRWQALSTPAEAPAALPLGRSNTNSLLVAPS